MRRAALAREHRRRPCSEELLEKIPIARGLSPGLSPCMAWTAKFGTTYITASGHQGLSFNPLELLCLALPVLVAPSPPNLKNAPSLLCSQNCTRHRCFLMRNRCVDSSQ